MDFDWTDDDDAGLADFDIDAVVDHARARKEGDGGRGFEVNAEREPEVVIVRDVEEEEESLARRRARLLTSTSASNAASGVMTITAPRGKFASANAKQISISSMFAVAAGTRAAPTTVAGEIRETLAQATTQPSTSRAAGVGDGWTKTKRKGGSGEAPRKHQSTLPKELMIRSANDKRDLAAMATNLAPEALGEQDSLGRTACAGAGGHNGLPMDPQAVQTYVYPAQISRRQYQYDIARNALLTNSLVCLPTGLGKTLIAAVVMYNYYRWFPTGKIIFMAPTRPLVDQQMMACHNIVGIPTSDTVVLMGSTKKDESGSRREFWRDKRLFFCTPHTVANDLNNGDLDANQIVCVVVDEAHHARGEYASAQVIRVLNERNINFRLLALTATPGQGIEEVQSVVETLRIGRIDFRSDQDPDVSRYTHKREMQVECVKPGQAISHVQDMLCDLLRPVCRSLLGMGAIEGGWKMKTFVDNKATNGAVRTEPPAWFTFQSAQNNIQRGETHVRSKGATFSLLQQAMELTRIYDLLLKFGPSQAYDYAEKRAKANSNSLLHSRNQVAIEIGDMLRSMSANGAHHSPKLDRLKAIIKNHFKHATADTRVIIFTSSRESVRDIVRALREVPAGVDTACKIKVAEFVGQSDTAAGKKRSGGGDGRTTKGQTQKEQKRTLNDFRAGSLNTLVSTSIGEEGLDIPSVDLIFFFDVVDIIRAIQRMGRTGRAREGKVVILATEGREFAKFTSEQKKYENLMRCLRTPANHFTLEKNCPRIIPAGVTPVCELRMIEASPALKTTKSKTTGKARAKKPPGPKALLNAAMKIKDTPLDSATKAILFAYDYPQGSALAELDVAAATPFLSRPDPVYAFEHSAWSMALVNVMADLHGIPRVDPTGEAIPGGPCAKARAKALEPKPPLDLEDEFVVPDSQEPPADEEHVEPEFHDHDDDMPLMEDYQWANDSQERPAYEAEIKTSQEVMDEFTQMSDPRPRRISMHSVSPSVKAASQARLESILAATSTLSPKVIEAPVEAESEAHLEDVPLVTMTATRSPNVIEASAARRASQLSEDDDSDSEDQYLFLSKRKRTAARALRKITNLSSANKQSPMVEASQKRSQERTSMPPPPPRQTPQSGEKSTATPSTEGSDDLCIKRSKSRTNARVLMSQFSPAERVAGRSPTPTTNVELVDIINDENVQRPRRQVRAPAAFKPRRNCFIDDEAEASDEEGGDDDERMTSGDERFIADSQEDEDGDGFMREHPGMGFQAHTQNTPGSSGGERAHLATTFAALGPRERRVVQDTPSPTQRQSRSTSKYDSSFIDDGSTMDGDTDDLDASVRKPIRTNNVVVVAPEKAEDGDMWDDDWDDDNDGVHDDGWGGDSQQPIADGNNDNDDDDDDGWGGDSQHLGEDSDGW